MLLIFPGFLMDNLASSENDRYYRTAHQSQNEGWKSNSSKLFRSENSFSPAFQSKIYQCFENWLFLIRKNTILDEKLFYVLSGATSLLESTQWFGKAEKRHSNHFHGRHWSQNAVEADSYLTSPVFFYFATKALTKVSSQYLNQPVFVEFRFFPRSYSRCLLRCHGKESIGVKMAQSGLYVCFFAQAWHLFAMHVKLHYNKNSLLFWDKSVCVEFLLVPLLYFRCLLFCWSTKVQ